MGKDLFKYFLICTGIYLSLASIEIFLLRYLINLINTGIWFHLIVYSVMMLIINPIVTKILADICDRELRIAKDGQ